MRSPFFPKARSRLSLEPKTRSAYNFSMATTVKFNRASIIEKSQITLNTVN
ncbi:MAG: hypothetical protein ACRCT1_21495 [Microcoleaceae cyanobacterium]